MSERSPGFGRWGHPDAWGEKAGRKGRTWPKAQAERGRRAHHCADCGALVRWDLDGAGRPRAYVDGVPHVCDPEVVLPRIGHRDGRDVLSTLRRVLVERRVHGSAV